MEKASIPVERRVSRLSDPEVMQIREVIDRDYVVEGDLRRDVAMNIKRLMDSAATAGSGIAADCRWRTAHPHQARTRKGPAKPIAGKKK